MKIDRAVSQVTKTTTPIYTATQNGEIVFSLIALADRACTLYLIRTTGGTPIEYVTRLNPLNTWKMPGKIVLRTGEGFSARVMEVGADWHSLPDWDSNPDWDNPGEISPTSAIAQIDLSVIQL